MAPFLNPIMLAQHIAAARLAALLPGPSPDDLDNEEMVAVCAWSSPHGYAQELNRRLRGAIELADFTAWREVLDHSLRKIRPIRPAFWIYRGIKVEEGLPALLARYTVGTKHTWASFSSCTSVRSRAYNGEILFAIRSRTGRSIMGYSQNPSEHEILLPRDTEFVVTSMLKSAGLNVIALREI